MNERRRYGGHYSSRPSTISQSHVEEAIHGRTSGPVYFLRNDDEWVLGELVVTDQWITFEGSSSETVSHPTANITSVGALDFFNYFESFCFEVQCVLPPPPTQRSKALSSARYGQQQQSISVTNPGTDSNTTNLAVLSATNLKEHLSALGRSGPSPTTPAPPAVTHQDEDPHHGPIVVSSSTTHDRLVVTPYVPALHGKSEGGGLGPLSLSIPTHVPTVDPNADPSVYYLGHGLQNNSNDNITSSNKGTAFMASNLKNPENENITHPQLRVEGQSSPPPLYISVNPSTLGVPHEGLLGASGSHNVASRATVDGALASPSSLSPHLFGASGQSVASNLNTTQNAGMMSSPTGGANMSMAANAGSLQSPHPQVGGGGPLSAAALAAASNVHLHHSSNNNLVNGLAAQNAGKFSRTPSMGGGIGVAGRVSPVNSMSAVRGAHEGLSVTPVLSPAMSFQDLSSRHYAGNATEQSVQYGATNPNNLSLPATSPTTTGPSPTSGGFYTFPSPPITQQATEKIVFKALSLNDLMQWLSAFDLYLDLGVLNKCGITIPSNTLEPSDEFGRLYKAFPACGGRLPDPPVAPPNALLDDNWGHELIDYKTKV